MRIHSLDELRPLREPVAVVVNSAGFRVDLSSFESHSVFFRTVPELLPEDLPLVVMNPTPVMIQKLCETGAFLGNRVVELWADAIGFSWLTPCLNDFDGLAISGVSSNEKWFKVGVQRSLATDRSAQDLVTGLRGASLIAWAEPSNPAPVVLDTDAYKTNFKSGLVQLMARVAKPVKAYLPNTVVHMLYKILRALQ